MADCGCCLVTPSRSADRGHAGAVGCREAIGPARLPVTGGGSANGTQIQLWDCNGTGAQQWRWRRQNRLVNPQSSRCLDVTGGGSGDATRLQLWDCNDTAAQAWFMP